MPEHGGVRSSKSSEESRAAFRALVPDDERVTIKPMFGSVAAFAGGQMFMGLFADELFFRLDEPDRASLVAAGGGPLEVMPGRAMGQYVTLPDWQARHDEVRAWAEKSLAYTLTLPPRKK